MIASGPGQTIVKRQLTRGTSLVERPRISPDAASVIFNVGYDSRANLFVMPIDGTTAKQLTFLDAFSVGVSGRLTAPTSRLHQRRVGRRECG